MTLNSIQKIKRKIQFLSGKRGLLNRAKALSALLNQILFMRGFRRCYEVGYFHGKGYFDHLSIEKSGFIKVEGWHESSELKEIILPQCFVDQKEAPLFQVFRTHRPDLQLSQPAPYYFRGVVGLYRLSEQLNMTPANLRLEFNGAVIFEAFHNFDLTTPHYSDLLDTSEVKHRKDIYGFGPPVKEVNEDLVALSKTLPGPLLDFGCGSGALVHKLRKHGIEASGLELDREMIIESLFPEVRDFVRLYNGEFPIPFQTGSFSSVIASEVIEHIPDYGSALSELSRIVADYFIVTVPDMSAIPINHHNSIVPWHLLEGTHVNFFTQNSLSKLLGKYFPSVEIGKINPIITNDSKWYCNLIAICRKQ